MCSSLMAGVLTSFHLRKPPGHLCPGRRCKKKVKIKITEQDIVEGIQCDCTLCPVARAVRRVVKDNVRIEVRDLSVLIEIPEQLLHMEKGVVMDNDIHEVEDDLFMHRTSLPAKARDHRCL
jgi:hypothetical protein